MANVRGSFQCSKCYAFFRIKNEGYFIGCSQKKSLSLHLIEYYFDYWHRYVLVFKLKGCLSEDKPRCFFLIIKLVWDFGDCEVTKVFFYLSRKSRDTSNEEQKWMLLSSSLWSFGREWIYILGTDDTDYTDPILCLTRHSPIRKAKIGGRKAKQGPRHTTEQHPLPTSEAMWQPLGE